MKVVPELVGVVREAAAAREKRVGEVGTVRVNIEHVKHKVFRATCGDGETQFEVMIDEPPIRGGQNTAPTPLHYFMIGAGS